MHNKCYMLQISLQLFSCVLILTSPLTHLSQLLLHSHILHVPYVLQYLPLKAVFSFAINFASVQPVLFGLAMDRYLDCPSF